MLTNIRTTRIEWGDCDPAGIIFYARYFEIFDVSTTMLIEHALGMKKTDYLKAYDFLGHPLVEIARTLSAPDAVRRRGFGRDHGRRLRPVKLQARAPAVARRCAFGRRLRDARLGGPRPKRSDTHEIAADPCRGRCEAHASISSVILRCERASLEGTTAPALWPSRFEGRLRRPPQGDGPDSRC